MTGLKFHFQNSKTIVLTQISVFHVIKTKEKGAPTETINVLIRPCFQLIIEHFGLFCKISNFDVVVNFWRIVSLTKTEFALQT